jgi:putative ABC transport system permease protein
MKNDSGPFVVEKANKPFYMLKNYFKTAWRFLLRNKAFTFINIIGLAIGTLCCLYIVLYVKDQYSYDTQYKNANDIYRIVTFLSVSGDKHQMATCSPPIAPALKNDFPEVAEFTRVVPTLDASNHLLRYKEKSFYNEEAFLVDSTFFNVFNFHFNYGNAASALTEPNSIVLLQPVADKLFDKENPIGKVITIEDADGRNDFKVTGIVDESLGKSNIHANMFIRINANGYGSEIIKNTTWTGNNFTYSYIKLNPGSNVTTLENQLPAFLNKYGAEQFKNSGMEKRLHLQPLTSIHTSEGYEPEITPTVSSSFLNILILIAALIQIIACINFMNLATAKASKRAKEVGVRKVVGAGKSSLRIQFLTESFLLSLLSVVIALPLLIITLPYLNQITHANILLSSLSDFAIWLLLCGIVVVTSFVAGSYPAFYLSTFQAIKVIKGNFTNHVSAAGIRRSLVVFQFVLSIILISTIIIIYMQLDYIKNKDLGFDKNQKLIFSFYTDNAKSKMRAFANDLKEMTEVNAVSLANNYMGQATYHDWTVYLPGSNPATAIDPQNLSSDENFVRATGIQIISGRDFRFHDSAKVLINEILMKRLGLNLQNAPGSKLLTGDERNYEVAGVMKDFNYSSLHNSINPFMIICEPKRDDIHDVIVNVNSNDYKTLLGKIETIWRKDLPSEPFEYSFLDTEVQHQYQAEITFSNIINSFTLMAILISCLGLFGLSAFSAEQRKKEIGVRKVLGASVVGIVQLLSKDFIKLIGISILIATPIAWWAMNKWLQSFSYRVMLSWWMFALAGVIAILITLVTVSFQSVKAAIANPMRNLRAE